MPHSTTSLMRVTAWLMLALGAVYAVTLVPGIRPTPGYRAAIDWWLNMTVDGGHMVLPSLNPAPVREPLSWSSRTSGAR